MQTLQSIFDAELDRLISLQQTKEPVNGLSSGFINLDFTLNGLKPACLYLLASFPEAGKTAFLLNLLYNITINKKSPNKALLYSLDVSASEVGQRLMSCNSSIPLGRISFGSYNPDFLAKIYVDVDEIKLLANNLLVEDNPICSIASIREQLETLRANDALPAFIAIDNADAIELPHAQSHQESVCLLYEQLKQIAKDFSIPIMVTTEFPHSYFEGETDQMPKLKMLKRKHIPQHLLDAVMFVIRPQYYEVDGPFDKSNESSNSEDGYQGMLSLSKPLPKGYSEAHLIVALNRFGPAITIPLIVNMEYQRFYTDEVMNT